MLSPLKRTSQISFSPIFWTFAFAAYLSWYPNPETYFPFSDIIDTLNDSWSMQPNRAPRLCFAGTISNLNPAAEVASSLVKDPSDPATKYLPLPWAIDLNATIPFPTSSTIKVSHGLGFWAPASTLPFPYAIRYRPCALFNETMLSPLKSTSQISSEPIVSLFAFAAYLSWYPNPETYFPSSDFIDTWQISSPPQPNRCL